LFQYYGNPINGTISVKRTEVRISPREKASSLISRGSLVSMKISGCVRGNEHAWKCGCRHSACTQSHGQIESFKQQGRGNWLREEKTKPRHVCGVVVLCWEAGGEGEHQAEKNPLPVVLRRRGPQHTRRRDIDPHGALRSRAASPSQRSSSQGGCHTDRSARKPQGFTPMASLYRGLAG
jgi:hypothetical protein